MYNKIINIDNLYEGFLVARKGRRHKPSVFDFETELGRNLFNLNTLLLNETYNPDPPFEFTIYCTAGQKSRLISAPRFKDLVVQHAIYREVYDVFDRSFIHDSYGCRKFKGTHRAADRCQEFMRKSPNDSYYLQMDIRRFYHRINHRILEESLARKIPDKRLVELMMKFCYNDQGFGLNIGNLLSQLYGLIYLDRFDHFVKRQLKIKNYIRYVDDMVIIGLTKDQAYFIKDQCEKYLGDNLELEFSKWRIDKLSKGINFVGYRTWRTKRFIRKRSLHTFSKRLKTRSYKSLESILAHAYKTSSYTHLISRISSTYSLNEISNFNRKTQNDIFLFRSGKPRSLWY